MKRTLLITISAIMVAMTANSQFKPGYEPERESSATSYPAMVSPYVPTKVTFAGETIDLDRNDLWERLDREMTSILYGHTNTMLTFKRANRYFPIMARILKEQNVPADFLYLACTESNLAPRAYSPAHAAGFWQLLAATGRQYGLEVSDEVDERYDPEKSTVAACKYLKAAYAKYGDWPTVAASYNAGMGRISSELSKQQQNRSVDLYLTEETSRYVFRIFAFKLIMENPKSYGIKLNRNQLYKPLDFKIVEVNGPVADWVDWAKRHGLSYAQLRDANPWIRAQKLSNKQGKTYKVRIPTEDSLSRSKGPVAVFYKGWIQD